MADLAELGFVVRTGELKDASSELDRVTAAGARAERGAQGVGRASDRMGQQIERSLAPLRQMQSLLAAIGLGLGARELIRTADEFKLVEGRIRLVTESQEELIATQERLFAISQRTRSEFSQTANLFASVARVSTESNDRILQLAETIQMAGVVSGGDQASLAAGIMQLTQALGSGVLRGEEFNSVMENTPRIAQALAAALGRTTGELRAMAAEGQLTSDVVFEALLSQSEAIRKEFEQMPLTVGQAMQVLGNEFGRYISQVDQSLGATERLAQGIVLLSQNLDSVMRVAGGVAVVIGARLVVALASAARSASLLSTALAFFGGPIGLAVSAVAVGIYLLATRTSEAEKAQQEYNAALDAADRYMTAARSGSTELAAKYREEADAALDAARKTLELERARVQAAIAAASVASNDPLDRFAAGMAGMTDSQAERKRQEALAGWEAQLARIDERLAAIAEKEAKVGQTAVAEGAGGAGGAADAGTVEQFEKLEAQLQRQLALYGQTTELAKLRYEMEHGSLQGLNDAQQLRLEQLAAELDAKAALTEQEKELDALRKEIEQASLERMDPVEREQERYAQQIEMLRAFHEEKLLTQEELWALELEAFLNHEAALTEAAQKGAQERARAEQQAQQTIQAMYVQTAQLAIGLLQTYAGQSKTIAIATIALEKGLALAQAAMNTAVGVTKAYTVDPTGALAAKVALMGKVQMGLIAATGLAQASQVGSGGAELGTPANPVHTASSTSPAAQPAAPTQRIYVEFEGSDDRKVTLREMREQIRRIKEENPDAELVF